jgi:hypothetical protein
LKAQGIEPYLVHLDKDFSEISAVRGTWPSVALQICFWHAIEAFKSRLSSPPPSRSTYHPLDAEEIVPDLDVTFLPPGHKPQQTRRSGPTFAQVSHDAGSRRRGDLARNLGVEDAVDDADEDYDDGELPPARKGKKAAERGNAADFCPPEHRDCFVAMFRDHYNWHSDIPPDGIGYLTAAEIYRKAAGQMYRACHRRGLAWLWAYAWEHWYRPARWMLWARSCYPDMPVWRTTTLLEAIWRSIKHLWLGASRRPPVDQLIIVLGDYFALMAKRRQDLEQAELYQQWEHAEPRWSNELKRDHLDLPALKGGRKIFVRKRKVKKPTEFIPVITLSQVSRLRAPGAIQPPSDPL